MILHKLWILQGNPKFSENLILKKVVPFQSAASKRQALADTFDPSIPRPGAFEPYNPAPFFAEVRENPVEVVHWPCKLEELNW